MSLQFLRIACLVPLVTLSSLARESTLVKMTQELYAWLQGTRFMEFLNETKEHDYESLYVILITFGLIYALILSALMISTLVIFGLHWLLRCVLEKIDRIHERRVDLSRRRRQAMLSRLPPHEEPAGQTVLVNHNTAIANTHENEQVIKLEEEDTEEILNILDIPDAPGTPNTPTTTALPDTPDNSASSDSNISAGNYQPEESPLDQKANQPRRTNRKMPPRGGLERSRSILESLGWVKVAESGHGTGSGIDGDMVSHE